MDKRKILLIDDDDSVLVYLTAKLSKVFDVVSTVDATEAAALARTHLPDVILCDIDMPEMSGGEVAKALEEDTLTARIPFIYLTSLVSPSETKDMDGLVSGRPGVSKRAQLSELLERIEEVLKR
jgi:CheY-like chemotaxis protein